MAAMDSAADPAARRTIGTSETGNLIISVDGYKLTLAPNGPAKAQLAADPTPTAH